MNSIYIYIYGVKSSGHRYRARHGGPRLRDSIGRHVASLGDPKISLQIYRELTAKDMSAITKKSNEKPLFMYKYRQ